MTVITALIVDCTGGQIKGVFMNLCDFNKYENRTTPLRIENRIENNHGKVLKGRAAVFNEFTTMHDYRGDEFQEKFATGCMNETLSDGHKIMALYNHSWSNLLGSTADNLKLKLKADSLCFELTPKGYELDRRIAEHVESGTIDGCSIGFRVLEDRWENKNDQWFRVIEKIELFEITLTPIPAYGQTAVIVETLKAPEADEYEERRQILEETTQTLAMLDEFFRP